MGYFSLAILVLLAVISLVACNTEVETATGFDNIYQLTKLMSKAKVISSLGNPVDEIGSGLSLYVYRINTDTYLLGFNAEDQLISITHKREDSTEYIILH